MDLTSAIVSTVSLAFSILMFIALALAAIATFLDNREWRYVFGAIGCAGAVAVSILMIVYSWNEHAQWQKEFDASYETLVSKIASLDRETGVYGRFRIGYGTVSDRPVYYYYREVGENTYTLNSLAADSSHTIYLVETDQIDPSIYKCKSEFTDPKNYYYNIYVPFGTVLERYSA